jgi:hypothetical protein
VRKNYENDQEYQILTSQRKATPLKIEIGTKNIPSVPIIHIQFFNVLQKSYPRSWNFPDYLSIIKDTIMGSSQ